MASEVNPSPESNAVAKLAVQGWVSLSKAAPIIGVSYPTALRMVRDGQLKVVPVGGVKRVYASEIRRFLEEGNANDKDSSTT